MFCVYILSSKPNGTLDVGMTHDLLKRVWEHKIKAVPGFTAKYGVDRLVWFEAHESLDPAFLRERQIKGWKRLWKMQLIEADNPQWAELYLSAFPVGPGLRRDGRLWSKSTLRHFIFAK